MAEVRGKFVWFDLMTTDVRAAAVFYGKVLGWAARDSGMPGQQYLLFSSGQDTVAGLMPVPEDANGAHPHWMGYIGVDDVDAYTERVKAAGGIVHKGPQEIPGVGRFSVLGDPLGAGVCLFTPAPGYQGSPEAAPDTPGRIGWCELHAEDGDKALVFYTGMFGWAKVDEVDMGSPGKYHILATGGPVPDGGIMTRMAGALFPPMWLFYWTVESIDAAVERVQKAGGRVMHDPSEVPGGSWIVQAVDPQGAMFALVAMKR